MVNRIINNHRKSNSYTLKINDSEIVLIDAGDFDVDCFAQWLDLNDLHLKAVFLTHEHSDHCMGINSLANLFSFELYCSEKCALNIKDPRQNLSKYLEEIDSFSINKKCSILEDYSTLTLGSTEFNIIETPGHSPGSMCILAGNFFFSGDSLMKTRTPLSFPHSNRDKYNESLLKIKKSLREEVRIYPGHGESFLFRKKPILS